MDFATMTDADLAALVKQAAAETEKRKAASATRVAVDAALAEYATATGLTLVQAWKKIAPDGATVEPSPAPTAPEFVPPRAGTEYKKGDRVTYRGSVFESLIDKNAWSPDAYPQGWKKLA